MNTKIQLLSIIISLYNEETVINNFYQQLSLILNQLQINHEIIFVNDGSTDNSSQILSQILDKNEKIKIINLSRNFGHEAAMTAGLEISRGDALIFMDADLQHPPALIKNMLEKFEQGHEIVNMTRTSRADKTIFTKILSGFFYFLLNKISSLKFESNATDFFLISRRVADILKNDYRERLRFLRGLIQTVGFKKTSIPFVAPKRQAGKSKYSLLKLIILSFTAISSFSNLPLYLGIISGSVFGLFSFIIGLYSIIMKLLGYVIPGYTTLVVLISFMFGFLLFIIGIVGQYIGIIFQENKQRPIYIIDSIISKD